MMAMSKEVFFTSLALGRTFTREEWWAWCREHPGSREPVVELQGFQFNSCDVCLNPNRIGFGKPGWCVEIETAINIDGKWIASHNYSVHHSGGGSGVSLICKESFDTEKEAVFNELCIVEQYVKRQMERIRKYHGGYEPDDGEKVERTDALIAKCKKLLSQISEYKDIYDGQTLF